MISSLHNFLVIAFFVHTRETLLFICMFVTPHIHQYISLVSIIGPQTHNFPIMKNTDLHLLLNTSRINFSALSYSTVWLKCSINDTIREYQDFIGWDKSLSGVAHGKMQTTSLITLRHVHLRREFFFFFFFWRKASPTQRLKSYMYFCVFDLITYIYREKWTWNMHIVEHEHRVKMICFNRIKSARIQKTKFLITSFTSIFNQKHK